LLYILKENSLSSNREDKKMEEFKEGMVVKLKSGGPKMTIVEINPSYILCEWFHENKHDQRRFHPQSLMIVEEEQEK